MSEKGPMRHLIEDHGLKPWLIAGAFEQQHRDLHRRGADHEHGDAPCPCEGSYWEPDPDLVAAQEAHAARMSTESAQSLPRCIVCNLVITEEHGGLCDEHRIDHERELAERGSDD